MEVKVSAKMKKGISLIEMHLGIKYRGHNFEDASKFLEENLPKLKGVDFRERKKPSDKQVKFISLIESTLKVTFEGSSMKEASDFITRYKPKYDEVIKSRKEKKNG